MAKKPLKTFTVNRRTWLHAGTKAIRDEDRARAKARHAPISGYTDKPNSQLFNPGVRMKCCLGFVAQQCGLPVSALRGVGTPADLAMTPKDAAKVAVLVRMIPPRLYDMTPIHTTNTRLTGGGDGDQRWRPPEQDAGIAAGETVQATRLPDAVHRDISDRPGAVSEAG